MKNLSKRMLTIASLCAFLSGTTQAQDTYWAMNSAGPNGTNQVYNTKTHQLTAIPAGAVQFDNVPTNTRILFNNDGDVLFSTGEYYLMYNGNIIPGTTTPYGSSGADAVIPLTGVSGCAKQYAVINSSLGSSSTDLLLKIIDVSNGAPVMASGITTIATNAALGYSHAVAAPVQSNGDHYFYFVSYGVMPGQSTNYPYIEQYTLHADGTMPTAVNSYGTTANYRKYFDNGTHFLNGLLKISNDGAYIAYQDTHGDMVTFNTTTQDFAVGPHISEVYGLAGVNINGTVRWYVSTATQFGTFVQGSTTYIPAILGVGIYSDIAQGADGQIYVARGGLDQYSNGNDLLSFDPYAGGVTFMLRATNCVLFNGNKFIFGNVLNGENTSEVSGIHTDFVVNGGRGTIITPKPLYTCTNFNLVDLTTPVQSAIHLNIVQVGANDTPVTGGLFYSNTISNTNSGIYDLKNLPGANGTWLGTSGHDGIYRIEVTALDGCSRLSSHIEYVKVISASATVDFQVQGPPGANCANGGAQTRLTSPTFNPHGQVSAPFCDQGWLGAASCGVFGFTSAFSNISVPSAATYNVAIDDVNTNTQIASQDFTSTQLPASLPFSSLASGYFISNYAAIKGTGTFKVSASVTTPECGKKTSVSYFKIINGGSAGNYWREAGMPEVVEANVFPNPATNQIHVAWTTPNGTTETKASLMIVDVLGRVVINKELAQAEGSNVVLLDVSMLAPGTYHYKLATASGEKAGTVVKQ